MTRRWVPFWIAIFSLLFAFLWNEWNLNQMRVEKLALRDNQTVITLDDASYLNPPLYYYQHGKLYGSDYQKFTFSIRPPGYGLFYFACLKLGGSHALFVLKWIQLLLYSLSVYCLFQLVFSLTKQFYLALISAILYGIFPISLGFLYYTLSEGITPALLICGIYMLVKFSKTDKRKWLWLAGLTFSFLCIVRPLLGILMPFILLFFMFLMSQRKTWEKSIRATFWLTFLSLTGVFTWQIVGKIETGKWLGLHPIYQNEIPGVFRAPHQAIWDCFKGWESSSEHFHETIVPFWEASLNGISFEKSYKQVEKEIPKEVISTLGSETVKHGFFLYRKAILVQKTAYENQHILPAYPLKEEEQCVRYFEQLAINYKQHHSFHYHVVTPVKVAKSMVFHSNLSLWIFQHTLRGSWWMETMRAFAYMLHITLFLLLIPSLFLLRREPIIWLALGVFVYLFYLAYVQRGIEERYTLPILSLLFVFSTLSFAKMKKHFFTRK